jgi:hypothetical protein
MTAEKYIGVIFIHILHTAEMVVVVELMIILEILKA